MRILLVLGFITIAASLQAAQEPVVKTISHGEKVELAKYLDPTRNTIVEFYADW